VLELLGCTGLDDSCLLALVRGCPELSHLSVDGLWGVSEAAIRESLIQLHLLNSVSLKEADAFATSGLRCLLTGCKSLHHVHLPAGVPVWDSEFTQQAQDQLDAWGAGSISVSWNGADLGTLHVQRVPAG
jgi:hypothetical protein